MRARIAIAAVVAVSCGSAGPAKITVRRPVHNSKCPDSGPPVAAKPGLAETAGWAVALQLCAFGDGFGLCNPSGEPTGMTGFWQLSPAEVASIDSALSAFLGHQGMSGETVRHLEQYGRQYLGFFRGARRYVFINAFPRAFGITRHNAEREVIAVCDNSWNVEYDIGAHQFANLAIDRGPRGR